MNLKNADLAYLPEARAWVIGSASPVVDTRRTDVACPRCNHTLRDATYGMNQQPSIRLDTSFLYEDGIVRIFLGGPRLIVEPWPEIPQDAPVDFFCPHCHAELARGAACADCGEPMIPVRLGDGEILEICAHPGCGSRELDSF